MCLLLETLKVKDRRFYNIPFHNERMNKARKELWNCEQELDLSDVITIPSWLDSRLFKCRVLYSKEIEKVEFIIYNLPDIKRLKLIFSDDISYPYKYADRSAINALYEKRYPYDDILIVKNNWLTDTSFCNIVLKKKEGYFTPAHCLLKGTKRQKLLSEKKITEKEISWKELEEYESLYLINAMIDMEDHVCIAIKDVY
jgi:4-amino-4-deoxychorismate lyase